MFGVFVDWCMRWGMPLVQVYHLVTGSLFLNTAHEEAKGFEYLGNTLLAPTHYLLAGETYTSEGRLMMRFEYRDHAFSTKMFTSITMLPFSLTLGSAVKALAYLSPETREHHKEIAREKASRCIKRNDALYESLGFCVNDFRQGEGIPAPRAERRPGDEKVMTEEKEALGEVIRLLSDAGIAVWLDCGALLGCYRYGGVIPWDLDLDVGIIQNDAENVKHALRALDQTRFVLQDWSSRDKPNTYLKIYVRKTGRLIDLYHFRLDEETRTLQTICSNADCMFMLRSWCERERRYEIPFSIDDVFPLKKANFDGLEVPVPNNIVSYLQRQYGENLDPCKVYNEETNRYEKDPSHPYWQLPYAH